MSRFIAWVSLLATFLRLLCPAVAQFPPPPEGVTTIKSKFHENITISYKQSDVCETTPGVKSYAGYVHLPPGALGQDYPINTFFWFFEARKDPHNAPLAIWLNGGPGGSSMVGALAENGPCFVGNDSNSTYLNPWSWNNEVNMLYLDQPNQVGFSYDVPTNITVTTDLNAPFVSSEYEVADFSSGDVPEQNLTFLVGTASSLDYSRTSNSSTHAAHALWHFAQTWFEEFPPYKPHDERISLFTESYGGHYGPAIISHFLHQNERIVKDPLPGAHILHISALGIVNGLIDLEAQMLSSATFPNKNTYGIHAFTDAQYHRGLYEFTRPGGAYDLVRTCRKLWKELDSNDTGAVDTVNVACKAASDAVGNATEMVYMTQTNHGWFDITHPAHDPFPHNYYLGFLNQHWVQRALGVPVNHTFAAAAVGTGFDATGDMARGGLLEDVAYVLDQGVTVALFHGDRDYACNWVGGEAASLAIPWDGQEAFADAGYAPLVLSSVSSGGLTRQLGNFSFTRVFQAGHMVPSYQPETAYAIFIRAVKGLDIATGEIDTGRYEREEGQLWRTEGPPDTWWRKSELLPPPPPECYLWMAGQCSAEEKQWIRHGTAVVKDWIVVGREGKTESERGGAGIGEVQVPMKQDL